MTSSKDLASQVERVGIGVKRKLDEHFKQWGNGLDYRGLLNGYSTMAKNLGLDLSSFAYALKDAGFIQIYNTPSGKRLVYSSDCPLSMEEIENQIMEAEQSKNG